MNPETTFLHGGLISNFGFDVNRAPQQVIVEVQALGENARGNRIKSSVRVIPVSVCDGCGVFDATLSYCCDNLDQPDTASCPTFGATTMCVP